MKLGIPTLCRYDLLRELILSAERGLVVPSGYIIVDNGGGLPEAPLREKLGDRLELIRPDTNLGVAASWNLIIDRAMPEPVVISNDDIVFGRETFGQIAQQLERHEFVEGEGWALFGQRPSLIARIGYYDENFWPAYYEDVDYDLRMTRARIERDKITPTFIHHGWATTKAQASSSWIQEGRERNHAYFIAKWGGESRNPRWNGTPDIFQYDQPFNGKPPPGWSNRQHVDNVAMRWDVLNYILEKTGGQRYLEIGVSNGECMKKVNATTKWGVDPAPDLEGVRAANFFCPETSESFFKKCGELRVDLVFIDGYHSAETVYAEVYSAAKLLDPQRGVICLHDANPHTEDMQLMPWRPGLWTGDVWKAVARLRSEGEFFVATVPSNYGTAIVVPLRRRDWGVPKITLPCSPWDRLCWKDLLENRNELLGILPPFNWKEWVDRAVSDG